jgi:beta-galactosidase/beta-glucuronidase
MRRAAVPAAAAVLCAVCSSTAAAQRPGGELPTRWAGAASSTPVPRAEYPRPQLRRARWRSLNGRWEFGFGARYDRRIRVPFTFEAPLSGIGREREVHERVRYRRAFTVPRSWRGAGRRVLLHFGAVDHDATVFVNGRVVGRHRGGYTPFSFDVTGALRPGRNVVAALVRDPAGADATQPLGKQRATGRIFYTRATGIWQSVWLEPVRADHVADLRLRPDLDARRLDVEAALARAGAGTARVVVSRRGRVVARAAAPVSGRSVRVSLTLPSVAAWSPESPALYDVDVALERDGRVVDTVRSYTAFRTARVRAGRFELNGRPYVLRGVLDQGYWPDGVYTAPSDAALRHDVAMARAYGYNLARKHVKVEDPRWYWHADRLGLLVAQDMPSSWDVRSPAAERTFAAGWRDMLATLDHHPSVVLWVAFNENWGRPSAAFQSAIVDAGRALDGTRPVIDASGSVRRDNSDMTDFHDYGDDLARYQAAAPARARWVGEFGGLTRRVRGHVWGQGRRPFPGAVRTTGRLVADLRRLTDQVNGTPGLSGYVYTQLYDVERELNGLMTYDRLSKVAPERIAAVNRGTR